MSRAPFSLLFAGFLVCTGCVRTAERRPAPSDEPVELQLLAFNDFHGNLEPPGGRDGVLRRGERTADGKLVREADGGVPMVDTGGGAYFASHLRALKATNPERTIIVSAGDLVGASPLLSAAYHDEPTIELMNGLGLDIAGVGNHEFDEGTEELIRLQKGGCHPADTGRSCARGEFKGSTSQFLSANVEYTDGGELFPRTAIREIDGAKVGFIGMTLEDTPTIVAPWGVKDLRFKDEVETVNALVPVLRAQGTEAIVVVVHEGGEQMAVAERSPQSCLDFQGPIKVIAEQLDPEVDVIASGHTHQAYLCEVNGILVTSAESYGRLITDIDLRVTRAKDGAPSEIVSRQARQVFITRDGEGAKDVADLVAFYDQRVATIRDRPVGYIAGSLTRSGDRRSDSGEHTMGNVIADAQLAAGRAAGADLAFMNAGGVRGDLLSTGGPITYGQLFTVHPFSNYLVMKSFTGAEVKQILEQQFAPPNAKVRMLLVSNGFEYAYRRDAPEGQHVDLASMKLDGKPMDPERRYRVVISNFLWTGGDGFTLFGSAGTDFVDLEVFDIDAMEAYLQPHGKENPLPVPPLNRVRPLD